MFASREHKGFSSIASKLRRMLGHGKRKRKAFAQQALSQTPSRLPSTYSTPRSAPLHIHDAPRSSSISPHPILHLHPHPEKKDLHTHPSPPLHSNPSPLLASVAPCRCPSEQSVHHTLWLVILLALLCMFLCIGKEIAILVATATHLILQLAWGLGLLARGPNVNYAAQASFHHHEGFDHSVKKDNMVDSNGHMHYLNRSSTIPPRSSGPTFVTSLQWNRRSKSWTMLHGSVEGKMQPSKAGNSLDSTTSEWVTISSQGRGNLSAKLKLQVMLLFTLGGLFYGRFLAMCMALCCIWIYSKMEKLFSFR